MKKITFSYIITSVLLILLGFNTINAQELLAVIQNPNVVLLDPDTGAIINSSFIDLTPLNPGTPKDIAQVGDELWVTDQLRDRIDRFDLDGNHLGQIGGQIAGGGLDNIKGLTLVNNTEVWVTNAGSNNDAPGDAIVRYDVNGNFLGNLLTGGISSFDIVDNGNGEVYISYIGASTTKIERRDYDGNVLGNILESGVVNFLQQIAITDNGILAAVFSIITGGNQNGLYIFSETDGTILDYWAEGNLRGVAELGNGEFLFSRGDGVHRLNPTTGVSTQITAGSGQYFSALNFGACTTLPSAPTGNSAQSFCDGATVADLTATGDGIQWYSVATGGDPLLSEEELIDGNSYFASQTVGGCESDDRLEVMVTLTEAPTPTGDAVQTFEEGATLADIVIDPVDVTWFATEADALAGTNPLPLETSLVSGETYYAVNIVDDCLSDPFAVTVTVTLGVNDFDSLNFSYYPNPTSGILTLKYEKEISEITVVNLLGQIVYTLDVNSTEVKVDLSGLQDAVYLMQVVSDGTTKTIKVVKNK